MSNEDKTKKYCVYVTDKGNSINGSGVLFYSGGDSMFVFTCAHVVDKASEIRLFFLKPVDVAKDQYEVFCTDIPREQIIFSPTDEVKNGEHTDDFVIIPVRKPAAFDIKPTEYFIGESSHDKKFYTQGYPNGVPVDSHPLEYLDCFHGMVLVSIEGNNRFTIRITDSHIDNTSRVYELKGISGSPIWDDSEGDTNTLLGLISSGYDQTMLLSKIFATKAQQIRRLMFEKFGITIERKILEIPEEDVGGNSGFKPVVFDGTIEGSTQTEIEKWIEDQTNACRCSIDDLQLQKAIDIAREAIEDNRFTQCPTDAQKKLMQHLLYCFEIGDLDDEFEALETDMVNRGFFEKYDILRHLTRSFMKKNYAETIEVAEEAIRSEPNNKTLFACAKVFLTLARAYVDDLPVEESIGKLLDEQESFIYETENDEDLGLIYQMIGYVYGERYHDYVNAVRFLNRSYRIGFDNIILESLGAAYYFLGIKEATREDGLVENLKIDRRVLYKARECFLIIIKKCDELYWKGTIRRVGMCIYDTFFFLMDNYRVLTIYPDIQKYFVLREGEDEYKFWRDVEMKYAKVIVQSGGIDTNAFPHIRPSDRLLLETSAMTNRCCDIIDQAMRGLNQQQIKNTNLERYVRDLIRDTENNVRRINREDRMPIYVSLMNMYGRGMQLFGWQKIDKLKYCLERIRNYGNPEMQETMENFLYEFEAPLEDVIQRFRDTFDKKKNINNWQELMRLYIRHGMIDKADEMYKELLTERKELISDEPEYAYRAYIDFITLYHRNLRDALQCFLDAKDAFRDTDIEGFWELELMIYTNTFNNPARFETERLPFLERGLITEEQYHRGAFIANMVNLNREKAQEHHEFIKRYPHIINPMTHMVIMQREEIHFLNWIGEVKPSFLPPEKSMMEKQVDVVLRQLRTESWHRDIDSALRNQFDIEKKLVIDAWGVYVLAETGRIELLEKCERVYITHFSIIRLLEELSRTDNQSIRNLLDYVNEKSMFSLLSPSFKAQIDVRNKLDYVEPASTVALGVEQECLIVLGDPELEHGVQDYYGSMIIRVTDVEQLLC